METLNKQIFNKNIAPKLKESMKLSSISEVPHLEKIIVNIGAGDAAANNKLMESVVAELTLITGQKPIINLAKKSIAAFKLRENIAIGCKVTLRGNKMYNFYNKLVNVAIPRIRDFQGVNPRSFDGHGNYSLGIKEQIIFPEIEFDKVVKVRGMDITFVTSSDNDEAAHALLKALGMPFSNKNR